MRHGYKLDIKEAFFHKLVPVLVDEMGEAYPLLAERADDVMRALAEEEARFSETLTQGMELLKKELGGVSGMCCPVTSLFKLYDTYGFPVDLTADVARELNMSVDHAGFDEAMEAQRARGRASPVSPPALGKNQRGRKCSSAATNSSPIKRRCLQSSMSRGNPWSSSTPTNPKE